MLTDIQIHLFYPLVFSLSLVIVFVLARVFKDKLDNTKDIHFKDKDVESFNKLIDKYPLVTVDFISKTAKEQNIENNQEIHEINKRFENLERLVQEVIKKCK